MKPGLAAGTQSELVWQVGAEHVIELAAANGRSAVVFSTPAMIQLMEYAARAALAPFLEHNEDSVGVSVNVEHLAATPLAAQVTGRAQVTRVDGRLVDFEISAQDAAAPIGRGTHRRAIINLDRFTERLLDREPPLPRGGSAMATAPNGGWPQLETLRLEIAGPIATVVLNRPAQLNAVDLRMTAEWERINAYLAVHPEIRVVIIIGAGRAFCAGDDVKEVGQLALADARELSYRQARMYLAWETLPQVMIAAVNGAALGGGCVCAYSADFRLAAHGAVFGMPEILLGWPPGYGVAQLTQIVGKARTLELCLTGKQISAAEAKRIGLVHDVLPLAQLARASQELAERLLALPAEAVRETKRLVHGDEGSQPRVAHHADTAAYLRCLALDDAREGIRAFVEKRPPRFRGK